MIRRIDWKFNLTI